MRSWKKLLSMVLSMIMLSSFVGCSNSAVVDTEQEQVSDVNTTEVQEEVQEEEEVETLDEIDEVDTEEVELEEVDDVEEVEELDSLEEDDIIEEQETETDDEQVDEEELDEEYDAETGATIEADEDEGLDQEFEQLALPKEGETTAVIKVAGYGDIKIKLFPDKAPLAVENFITHAKSSYYDGIIFHRVIDDFMIQGGDPTGTGMGGSSIWGTPFVNEDDADLYHFNGALSMANAGADTNGSQFFIVNSSPATARSSSRSYYSDYAKDVYTNIGGTPFLDGGYTVFGQVYEGLDIVQKIMKVATTGAEGSTPVEDVVIESIIVN